ncbi:MAG: DNA-directed RNA polymerase subunit beta, partial [Candidatus Saccharibacteria bacterium]|nr:DNA-directed RNA polymerase subunit beta [Candidatus Saccharibacteria bacterium]
QIIRSSGVFFEEVGVSFDQQAEEITQQVVFAAKIIPAPDRGTWLRIETSPKDNVIYIVINHKFKTPVTNFLQAIGMTIDEIYRAFANVDTGSVKYISETFKHKNSMHDYNNALIEIYRYIRPGDIANLENAKEALENKFFNQRYYDLSKVGRYKINQRLGLKTPNTPTNHVLKKSDFIAIISEVIRMNNTPGSINDDIDNLGNRRLRLVGELIQKPFRTGLVRLEKNIRERMLRLDIDSMTPQQLINSRPVVAVVKTFFATNQLSQYMDQANPLSELATKRRLSAMGQGGLTRDYAKFTVRDAHPTHYGRICPVETPEGANIGLVMYMALYSRINEYGFLETPYYQVLNKALAQDMTGQIAGADLTDLSGKVIVASGNVVSQAQAQALAKVDPDKYWPVKPRVLKDKIVYLDANQENTVLLLNASAQTDEDGYFINPVEAGRLNNVANYYNTSDAEYMDLSARQILGSSAGLIPFVEKDNLVRSLTGANQTRQAVPLIQPKPPVVGTGLEKIVTKYTNQLVSAEAPGEVIKATADEVVVKYDKVKKTYPVTHFERSNNDTAINQHVVVCRGQKVEKGQALIEGMSVADGELALGRDVLVALAFWGGDNFEDAIVISERLVQEDVLTNIKITEYTTEVRETKLGPEVTTLDIPNVSEEALRNLDETGIIRVGARVKEGDILVGKITPKGEQELSSEERLLRAIFGEKAKDVRDTSLKLPNGKTGKIVGVNVFSRDQGHDLKAGILMQVQVFVAQTRKIQVGDKLAGRHGNKGVIAKVLPAEDMPFTEEGQPVDLILNPLGVPKRLNVGQLFEATLGIAAHRLNFKIASPTLQSVTHTQITDLLKLADLPQDGKQQLYDGRTGKAFKERTMIGYMYIYKLTHMVEDKINARSTGPYMMITQQPLRGKSQNGGQRLGEMEVWVLASYGATRSLQEMLTLKSDDMHGRLKVYESIVKQLDIVDSRIPESFNVLVKELQGLGLKIDLIDKHNKSINAEEVIASNLHGTEANASSVTLADLDASEELEEDLDAENEEIMNDEELQALLHNNPVEVPSTEEVETDDLS